MQLNESVEKIKNLKDLRTNMPQIPEIEMDKVACSQTDRNRSKSSYKKKYSHTARRRKSPYSKKNPNMKNSFYKERNQKPERKDQLTKRERMKRYNAKRLALSKLRDAEFKLGREKGELLKL